VGCGEYTTVEEANIYARVPDLLRESLLNIGVWIVNILQISTDKDI